MNNNIEVIAKVGGYHPVTGLHLVEGDIYQIDENYFADEVFERPYTGWQAPWERKESAAIENNEGGDE